MEELAVGEDETPHLIMVLEVESPTAVQAVTEADKILGGFRYSGKVGNQYEVRDSILYRIFSDVRSD